MCEVALEGGYTRACGGYVSPRGHVFRHVGSQVESNGQVIFGANLKWTASAVSFQTCPKIVGVLFRYNVFWRSVTPLSHYCSCIPRLTFMTLRVFGKLAPILSNTRKFISPPSILPKRSFHSCLHATPRRQHSTVYSPVWPRLVEKEVYVELIDTLMFLLRRVSGREYGLGVRDDDYVSVKELLNHPQYCWMDMPTLQTIIDNDIKHRFILKYDPAKGDDCWWIRVKRWDEKHFVFKPLTRNDNVETVVYTTSPKAWNSHISKSGIPRPHDEYIRLSSVIPTINFLQDLNDEYHVFIYVDIPKCVKAGLHFFLPTPTSQWSGVSTLLTKGDHLGYIPPDCFKQVQLVKARKNLLFGEPDPLPNMSWARDGHDYDENGQKRTLLLIPEKNLKGFVNLTSRRDMDNIIHPETRREALEVLNVPLEIL